MHQPGKRKSDSGTSSAKKPKSTKAPKTLAEELKRLEGILYTKDDTYYNNIKLFTDPPVFTDWDPEIEIKF